MARLNVEQVLEAVKKGQSLAGADLSGLDLNCSNLSGSNLSAYQRK